MRQRDFVVPLALLGGIAVFVVVQVREVRTNRAQRIAVAATPLSPQGTTVDSIVVNAARASETANLATVRDVVVRRSTAAAPAIDTAYVRDLIRESAGNTYLSELLAQQNNSLVRWPDRQTSMRVWIERDVPVAGWDRQFPVVAERAFAEWQEAGFPLRFDMILEPRDVDITIKWIEKFPAEDSRKIGMATKVRDQHGWLVSVEITIATHDSRGRPLAPDIIAGTARHEIGHALGLGHSSAPTDVMFPESRTPVISAADRQTLRVLYMLPPGRMP